MLVSTWFTPDLVASSDSGVILDMAAAQSGSSTIVAWGLQGWPSVTEWGMELTRVG